MVPFESLGAVSYFPSIVIMALSCIISEISPLLIANRDFFIPVAFGAPVRGSSSEYCNSVWCRYSRMMWLSGGGKFDGTYSRFDIIPASDRRTDGQTDRHLARA